MAGQYAWNAADGLYGSAANWRDLATGDAPLAAPDPTTDVMFPATAAGRFVSIAGSGEAAGLSLGGNYVITAALVAGSLAISGGDTVAITGGSIDDVTALVGPGVLQVSGAGGRFTTSGLLTVAGLAWAPGSGMVSASNHATVQAGTLVLAGGTLVVDGSSSMEVGSAGAPAAGMLTVDAGATLSSTAGLISGSVVNQGVLLVTAGKTSLFGTISGAGQLQIGTAGTLYLPGPVAAAATVAFATGDGLLQLTGIGKQFAGSITGFTQGDGIDIAVGTLTAATWAGGILTLVANSLAVMTLRLAGAYSGAVFLVRPDGGSGTMVTMAVATTGAAPVAGAAPAGTATPDRYGWIGGSGAWSSAANWADSSAGQSPALLAPGSNDIVGIAGPVNRSILVLTGPGNSASLAVTGNVALSGSFATGGLQVGNDLATGTLDLRLGSAVVGAGLVFGAAGGQLNVNGGAKLTVTGTVGLPSGAMLSLTDSSTVKFTGMTLAGGTIAVAGNSRLEIGTGTSPAVNAVTVDAGATLTSGGGLVLGGLTVRGTLLAIGGRTGVVGLVGGTGLLQINDHATLALAGQVAANDTIAFAAGIGLLQLGAAAGQCLGLVTGFDQGDAIDLTALQLTDAIWASGTLALGFDGTAALSLRLAGNYGGASFLTTPDGTGGTLVSLVTAPANAATGPPPPGTATWDAFDWTAMAGGGWADAGNWNNLASGGPAAVAPGANNPVRIVSPRLQLLTGQGNSVSLSVGGSLAVAGQIATGALSLGGGALLDVVAGGRIAATSAGVDAATLLLNGIGATVTVAASLAVGTGLVSIGNGASLRSGALSLAGGTIQLDPAGSLEVGTDNAAAPGMLWIDAGATLESHGGIILAAVCDMGSLLLAAGTTSLFGLLGGSGSLLVADGATLNLAATAGGSMAQVVFAGTGGSLRLGLATGAAGGITADGGGSFAGSVAGFRPGAAINFANVALIDASFAEGLLSMATLGGVVTTLRLTGDFTAAGFHLLADGAGGTDLTVTGTVAPCFVAGTRIRIAGGERAVEDLRIGDLVVTLSGRGAPLKRIVWIGWRRVEPARHPRPDEVTPIRVAAHALAPGMPQRDLLLSPDHAVFLAGAGPPGSLGGLVPVRYLLNGASIRREPSVGTVLYFHVELAEHDLLLAEGLAAESYLDTGNRAGFANGGGATQLHMDMSLRSTRALRVWHQHACAPLTVDGPGFKQARTRLLQRAPNLGWHQTADPDLRLLTNGGELPASRNGDRHCFTLPPGEASLRLLSRSAVPAEMHPCHPDHRRLGVAVAGIALDGVSLGPEYRGVGWHAAEPGLCWTAGDAALTLPAASYGRRLAITLRPLLDYWWRAEFAGQPSAQISPAARRSC